MAGATIRRKLAALASLFDHLLESNAIAGGNPVHRVKRPRIESNACKTPALGDHQAKALLEAPDESTLKGLCDRAIFAVLLYHGLRREEAALLQVSDIQDRRGIQHLQIHGKGERCGTCLCTQLPPDALISTWQAQGISNATSQR